MKTLEGKIVCDIDKIDTGVRWIVKTVTYGGYKRRFIYDFKIKPTLHKNFTQYKNSKGTSINRFYEKNTFAKRQNADKDRRKNSNTPNKLLRSLLWEFFDEWKELN